MKILKWKFDIDDFLSIFISNLQENIVNELKILEKSEIEIVSKINYAKLFKKTQNTTQWNICPKIFLMFRRNDIIM